MKTVCALWLIFVIGCTSVNRPTTEDAQSNATPITILSNLEHVDAVAVRFAHPLVCGEGGDYPNGRELVFRVDSSTHPIHVVFPETDNSPQSLDGRFVLYGYYQTIQNWGRFVHLKPHVDYKYFVVMSWEHKE